MAQAQNIDYRYLKAFQKTAETLNFSQAASELNIAQSAISRQIKLLEEGMGEQLIIRSSKKVILTTKGEELLSAIKQFEKLTFDISKNQEKQVIKIGILERLLENWFIHVIKEFSKISNHELNITIETPDALKEGLIKGKFDIIFAAENIQNDIITSLKLFDEKFIIISKKEIDTKKIHKQTWIVSDKFNHLLSMQKVASDKIITVHSLSAIVKLVKENIGIAIVPEHLIRKEDRLIMTNLRSIKKNRIHLSTLNFTRYPSHFKELINAINTLPLP